MDFITRQIDFSRVKAIICHLPEGESFALGLDSLEHFFDYSRGRICDTSEIDGLVHFFPEGNA